MHILLFSGNKEKATEIRQDLIDLGYDVLLGSNLSSESEQKLLKNTDLILVEAVSGLQAQLGLLKKIKGNWLASDLPVLVFISEADLLNFKKIEALVNDFVIYPYSVAELKLRLSQIWQKTGLQPSHLIKVEGLVINLDSYEVFVDSESVALTYKEFELLKFLALHPHKVYTREELAQRIWQYEFFAGTRTVDVHIRRLRHKLGKYQSLIKTVRNVGYRFG